MAFTPVTVFRPYFNPDGSPATGSVTFTVTDEIAQVGVGAVPCSQVEAVLGADGTPGYLSVTLYANDDSSTEPSGTGYNVVENIDYANQLPYQIVVPNTSSRIDLSSLAHVTTTPLYGYDPAGAAAAALAAAEAFTTGAVATETTRAETAEAAAVTTAETFATGAVGTETTRAETAEALKAPLASPALTGTPTAPTAAALTDDTQIATTAFTTTAIAAQGQFNYIGSNGAYDDKPGLVALEALIQATPFGAGTIHKHGLVTLGSSWAAPQGIMPEGDGVGYDNGNQSWNGGTVVAPYSTFTGGPGPLITYTLSGSNTGSCKHIGFSGVPLAATGGTSTPGMTGVMISGGADFFFEDVCFAGFDTGGVGAGGVMGGGILANNHVGGRVLKCFTASNGYGIALTGTSTDWAISMHKGNGNNISLIQGVGVQADNCGGLLIDECHYTGSGNITTATANLCLMASVQSEAVTGVITSDTLTLYSNTVFVGTVTVTINGTPVSFGFNASGATIETAINAALGAGTVTANAGGPLHTASCLVSGGTTTTPTLTNNGATTTVAVAINGVLVTFAYNASGATIAAAINAALGAGTVTGSSGADLATGAVGLTFAVAPSSFVVLGQPVVLTFATTPSSFAGFYAQALPTLPYHWYLAGTASDVAYATNMYFDNCDPNGFHIYTECTGLTIASGKFLMRDNSTANCFIQTNTGVGNINPSLMLGDGVQFSGIGNGCAAVALVQFMEQAGQPAYVTIGHVRAIFASTYTPNTDTVTMTVGSNFIGDASASAAYVNSPVVQTNAFAYPGAYVIAYQASPQGILVSQVVTTAKTSLTVFPFNAYIDSAGNPVQPFEHAGGRLKLPVYGGL
jgi:hypothetical protein